MSAPDGGFSWGGPVGWLYTAFQLGRRPRSRYDRVAAVCNKYGANSPECAAKKAQFPQAGERYENTVRFIGGAVEQAVRSGLIGARGRGGSPADIPPEREPPPRPGGIVAQLPPVVVTGTIGGIGGPVTLEGVVAPGRTWAWRILSGALKAIPKKLPRRAPRRFPRRAPAKPGRTNPAAPPRRGPMRRTRPARQPDQPRVMPGQPVIPVPGPMFPGRPGNPPALPNPAQSPARSPTAAPVPAPNPRPGRSPGEPPPRETEVSPNAPISPAPVSPTVPRPGSYPRPAPGPTPTPRPGPASRPAAPPAPAPLPVWRVIPWLPLSPGSKPASWPKWRLSPRPSPSPAGQPSPLSPPLTGIEPGGVASPLTQPVPRSEPCESAQQRQRKKRKRRKRRTVCYRGTYRETATGLMKWKKERVSCRPSSAKRP